MFKYLAAGVVLLAAGLALGVALGERRPVGPQPIAWDREACAHCHMHIGDPRFAAQLQTQAGEVLSFDDPGCLLAHLEKRRPDVHALYFHHLHEDRWLSGDAVAFVDTPAEDTPMGHGLGAVDPGTAGSMPLDAARKRVVTRGTR